MAPVQALIFDFGHVLCSWTPTKDLPVAPETLKLVMSSDIWHEYERGHLSQEDCYSQVAVRFSIDHIHIADAMTKARNSLILHEETMNFIQQIRESHPGGFMVYGMTNTPLPEQDIVRTIQQKWPVFDHIYIAGTLGMRKPELRFYQRVLAEIGLPGETVVFVDDQPDNIMAARSIGMHGILFDNHGELCRQLHCLLGNPVARGKSYLAANAKVMESVTNKGETFRDNFAQLLIFEATWNR